MDTIRKVRKDLTGRLIKELSHERIATFLVRTRGTVRTWSTTGMPYNECRLLAFKYPHLLTWEDFGIKDPDDISKFLVD